MSCMLLYINTAICSTRSDEGSLFLYTGTQSKVYCNGKWHIMGVYIMSNTHTLLHGNGLIHGVGQ